MAHSEDMATLRAWPCREARGGCVGVVGGGGAVGMITILLVRPLLSAVTQGSPPLSNEIVLLFCWRALSLIDTFPAVDWVEPLATSPPAGAPAASPVTSSICLRIFGSSLPPCF